jgi:hypothetical protein
MVALIFAGTNWLVTRELDRRERDESNAPDQTT